MLVVISVIADANHHWVMADDTGKVSKFDELNWHGFLSQGFSFTNKNNFLGPSENGSFKFNEAALNASWRPLNEVQLSAQVLYKQIGNSKPNGTELDYGVIDWRLVDNFNRGFGLRIGRLKNPYGFFNETRDVASTRPSLLLPESIYVDYLRTLIHSSDSVGLYGHQELEQGTISVSAVYGVPILNEQNVDTLVQAKTSGNMKHERSSAARISYEDGSGLWRTAFSYISFEGDFKAGPQEASKFIFDGKLNIQQQLFSVELNWNHWQFISEYQFRNIESLGIRGMDLKSNGVGYYCQFGYQFGSVLKVYLRQDNVYLNKNDKSGKSYSQSTGGLLPARDAFAKDSTIGLIYSPSLNWSFGLEVHRVNGTLWLPNIENPAPQNASQQWNMFLAQVAYQF